MKKNHNSRFIIAWIKSIFLQIDCYPLSGWLNFIFKVEKVIMFGEKSLKASCMNLIQLS